MTPLYAIGFEPMSPQLDMSIGCGILTKLNYTQDNDNI